MKSVVKPKQSDEEKQLIEPAFIEKKLSLCSYVLRKMNMVVNYQETRLNPAHGELSNAL